MLGLEQNINLSPFYVLFMLTTVMNLSGRSSEARLAIIGAGRLLQNVLGDCVAKNRGADFVEHLALALCARTRYSTGHRTPINQTAFA